MDSTKQAYQPSSTNSLESDLSPKIITAFLWLFFLFIGTAYIAHSIIFQSIDNFSEDIRNMEDMCDQNNNNYDNKRCICAFDYLEGLDHPQFQYILHKMQIPQSEKISKEKNLYRDGKLDPSSLFIEPTAYVLGCGNNYPERRLTNEAACEQMEKLMTTDLYSKWWYGTHSCFNSLFNTIKRAHLGLVVVLILIFVGIILTPFHVLQTLGLI